MLKKGASGVLCKLHFERVYDHANWEFLDYMLGRLGFGIRWRNWMKKCHGTTCSILLNGSSVEYFYRSNGLQQGDPLSPFLFAVVVEAFGALLTKAFQGGLIEGFEVGRNGMMVSHL